MGDAGWLPLLIARASTWTPPPTTTTTTTTATIHYPLRLLPCWRILIAAPPVSCHYCHKSPCRVTKDAAVWLHTSLLLSPPFLSTLLAPAVPIAREPPTGANEDLPATAPAQRFAHSSPPTRPALSRQQYSALRQTRASQTSHGCCRSQRLVSSSYNEQLHPCCLTCQPYRLSRATRPSSLTHFQANLSARRVAMSCRLVAWSI